MNKKFVYQVGNNKKLGESSYNYGDGTNQRVQFLMFMLMMMMMNTVSPFIWALFFPENTDFIKSRNIIGKETALLTL